ncbi:major facilitator superfamily domain-containing protein [Dissophora ornata]|nr:major facilitator superfamily domain-containing protein [Dissophora ornata]
MLKLSDPMAQVIILGFICFCCPGMFNALQGTGTYGLSAKDSDVGNHAGTALSVVFAFSSLFAGALFNIMGHRLLLILGGLTYVLYVGSFLAYNYIQSIVFVVIASCLLGIGAGWLWCAQGAVMMGYPDEGEKGKYFSIFWAIFNCGGVLGNVIPLGIQWNDSTAGGASTGSYVGYMVVMTVGSLISVLLLPTSKVIRKDGSHVVKIRYSSPIDELKSVFALFKDWRMLALVPMFFSSNWFYTYQFTAVNAFNFTVRTRSMNSMFYWFAQILASIAFGSFLDRPQWSRPTRARYGLILLTTVLAATWIGGIVFQTTFGPRNAMLNSSGVWVKNTADFHMIDLVDNTSEYMGPFFLYFFYGVSDAMYQGYSYWLMGALTNDTNQAARFAGFYKFVQNLGGVLAPVVQTSVIGNGPSDGYNALHATGHGMGEIIITVVLVFLGVLGAFPVAFKAVKDHTVEDGDDVVSEKQEAAFEDIKA